MSPAPGVTEKPLHQPRPGHADLVGMQKYGFDDARNVLERASARETAARVAAGTLAKLLLAELGTEVAQPRDPDGRGARAGRPPARRPADLAAVDDSPVRCFDPAAEAAMIAEVEGGGQGRRLARRRRRGARLRRAARASARTSTGTASIDGLLAQALDEHPGHEGRRDRRRLRGRRPARAATPTTRSSGTPTPASTRAGSTRAGGTEGGMTTGGLLVARVAMKPLATLNRPVLKHRRRRDQGGDGLVQGAHRRHRGARGRRGRRDDGRRSCSPTEVTRKFGGDSLDELVRNHAAYLASLR